MAFNIAATLRQVETYLRASGYVSSAEIGEPKSPPMTDELHAAIFMENVSIVELMAGGDTVEVHVPIIRLYREADMGSRGDNSNFGAIELELAEAVSFIAEDLLGDFDLGGNIRNVDAAGAKGTSMSSEWGHADVGGTMFRIVDITLPLIVDGSATAAA